MIRVLYISLTGMTESLGESQVVQYITQLSKEHKMFLLSFEKNISSEKYERIKKIIQEAGIQWKILSYSNRYGIFSTVLQIINAFFIATRWIQKEKIQVVHARSLIPALMGCLLKKGRRMKLLFDIRGFVLDEKVIEGRLKKTGFFTKMLKRVEKYVYKNADHIVTLTHVSKPIIKSTYEVAWEKITVIPTCADMDMFAKLPSLEKGPLRKRMGFNEDSLVFLHNGSLNSSIDFLAEIKLFEAIAELESRSVFLFLNNGQHDVICSYLEKSTIDKTRYQILSVELHQVKHYLNCADVGVFFIKPSFAKQASAPTKFAEMVACQLYSITNTSYGDMEYYFSSYKVGHLLDLKDVYTNPAESASHVLNFINSVKLAHENLDFERLYVNHFSKELAVKRYNDIYSELALSLTKDKNYD